MEDQMVQIKQFIKNKKKREKFLIGEWFVNQIFFYLLLMCLCKHERQTI